MTVVLSVLSAVFYGTGMALQQRGARTIAFEHALSASVVRRLVARPVWLAGIGLSSIGFLLQLAALRNGALVTVAPIVTSALVVCLGITAWWDDEPLGLGQWRDVLAVVLGVALFLTASAARHRATTTVALGPLLAATVAFVALVGMCVSRARTGAGTARALAVGAGAGLGNAYVAVLVRASADSLRHGIAAVLRSPYPYALAVAIVVTVLLVQAIYQAGRPTLSLPLAMVVESAGSVLLAVGALRERPSLTGLHGAAGMFGLLLALAGLVDLSRERARATAAELPAPIGAQP